MRRAWWVAAALSGVALSALWAAELHGATLVASAYSPADSGSVTACGPRLDWSTPTVATPPGTWPCGARLRVCLGRRCVTAVRTDSGPFIRGRGIDLAPGTYRALGYRSPDAFGVRAVTVREVR